MSIATERIRTTMLYCPKCRSTYEEGTQRFCSNDGGRLLPVQSKQESPTPGGGVFTSIIGKMPKKDAGDSVRKAESVINPNFAATPKPEPPKPHAPISKIYEAQRQIEQAPIAFDDDDSILELDLDRPLDGPSSFRMPEAPRTESREPEVREPEAPETEPADLPETKIAPRLVNPFEIPSGTADVGDRAAKPIGRDALSWDNPDALIGQTVKGRYVVRELVGDFEDSLEYLADDQIAEGRQTVVRVFMDDQAYSERFAEQGVSLSHLNHPNIAAVFDSGELPEGFRFVVSEYVDGQSLASSLRASGQFNIKRTARIIRQASYALSEAHENGILHRNIKPENIMLTVSDAGIEQVKLINFDLSDAFWNESDLVYKSPEEIVGETPTFASEIFSLAVVAYEMLCARLPFNGMTERELLTAQEAGLKAPATSMRVDVPELADRILNKALSIDPAERYPKARDFGDAFFNALTTQAPWEPKSVSISEPEQPRDESPREFVVVPPIVSPEEDAPVNGDIHIATNGVVSESLETSADASVARDDDQLWFKRSPEPPRPTSWFWGALPFVGVLFVLIALWGIWKLISSRPAPAPTAESNIQEPLKTPQVEGILKDEVDRPPDPRQLKPVEGATRFANNQENLKGDLAKNFLGFEIWYPSEMKRSEDSKNFLDIATRSEDGIPIEQMIVTRYKSRGAMTLDRPNFKKIAETSSKELREYIGESFKVVGEGETNIQNGRWQGYEVKFEGVLPDGKTKLYGRRLWIPVQSPGTQNGFVLTLLATSLAEGITGVADVGTKGNLAVAIENFEPEQRF